MALAKNLSIFFVIALTCLAAAQAATLNITNSCNYTIWAAAVPGGGQRLDPNQTWSLNVTSGTSGARLWGRTNCTFDSTGNGTCLTGDCKGVLECDSFGTAPNTLVEYALNQYNDLDFYDVSVVDGFNIPLSFTPLTNNCTRSVNCTADINNECPSQLKAPGGCNNPCTVFKTSEYCCMNTTCGPTDYSKFFKTRCPDVFSYPKDDVTSTFTCPGGTDYSLVFCP